MSCPGDNYIVPGANPCAGGGGGGVAGVASLNAQTGVVNIVPSDGTIVVTSGGGQIGLSAVLGGNVVTTLNGIIDDVNITSSNGSVTITPDLVAKTVNLSVASATPATVTNITGSGIATVTNAGTVFNVDVPAPTPTVTNILGSGEATVTNAGSVFTVAVPTPPSATVTNITGSGIANVTSAGSVFNVEVPAPPSPTVTNITGSGVANVTSASGVFNVDVPTPPSATVTNITGSGIANVTSSGTDFNVDVPTPSVTNITGSGIATVSNASGVFNVDVPGPAIIDVTASGIAVRTESGGIINIDVPAPPSATVTNITGSGIANVTSSGTDFNVDVPAGVASLKTLLGAIDLVSSDSSIAINADGGTNSIDLTIVGTPPVSGVTSVNGVDGIMNITCADGSLVITPDTGAKTVDITLGKQPVSPANFHVASFSRFTNSATNWTYIHNFANYDHIAMTLEPVNNLQPNYQVQVTIPSILNNAVQVNIIKSQESCQIRFYGFDGTVTPPDPTGLGFNFDITISTQYFTPLTPVDKDINISPYGPLTTTLDESGLNVISLATLTLPSDYAYMNNPSGVNVTLTYCGSFTATRSGRITYGLRDGLLLVPGPGVVADTGFYNTGDVIDYGSTLDGTYTVNDPGFVIDELNYSRLPYVYGYNYQTGSSGVTENITDMGIEINLKYIAWE
jgi:hypothetical protein